VGGCLQFERGELGWERRRRNRGGESRQSVDILAFTDGITDGHVLSVYPSVILTVNGPCQLSLYGDPGLNPLVILSVQSSEKIPRHQNVFFLGHFISNSIDFRRFFDSELMNK
jgi:hypothetical protein